MSNVEWAPVYNVSRKWHYFVNGTALCRNFMSFSSQFEEGNDQSPDNCAACRRAKLKLTERSKK